MPDLIIELLATEVAIDKLGARGIAAHDARQIPGNPMSLCATRAVLLPASAACSSVAPTVVESLTLVIEQTIGPTTWLIVTGWDSSQRERRLLRS